ncbi:MAG: GAF domain-containing protein, partial [Gammaproteobacteria bacterium]
MMALLRKLIVLPFGFWRRSLRRQLIFGFSSVTIAVLSVFSGFLFLQQMDFLQHSAVKHATALVHALANSCSSRVSTSDIAGLQEVLRGFDNTSDLTRAYVLSLQGEVLGSTRKAEIGSFVDDDVSRKLLESSAKSRILIADTHSVDVAEPVMVGDRQVGWARIALTLDTGRTNLLSLAYVGLVSSLAGALFSLVAAAVLARRLTKKMNGLMHATHLIASGRRDVHVPVEGTDEVAVLSCDFNRMLDAMIESEQKRKLITDVYAAWTHCAEIMVRVSDERILMQQICQVLADRLNLKTVWIGLEGPDHWIYPVAVNLIRSHEIKELRVSSDPFLPEGKGHVGIALREGRPSIFNDCPLDGESAAWLGASHAEDIRSVGAFPLTRNGRVTGAVIIYSTEKHFFNRELISLMNGLAGDISFALDKLDLV